MNNKMSMPISQIAFVPAMDTLLWKIVHNLIFSQKPFSLQTHKTFEETQKNHLLLPHANSLVYLHLY